MGQENNLEPGDSERTAAPIEGDEPAAQTQESGAAHVPVTPGKPLTPGQRLAAKKAQKAIAKKEFKEELKRREEEAREKEREEANRIFGRNVKAEPALPAEVEKVAGTFTDFMQRNRGRILGGIAAFVGVSALFLVGQHFVSSGDAEQAQKLAAAIELTRAPIDPDDADGKTDDGDPVFKSRDERAQKAEEAYQAAIKLDPKSDAAGWATLALASLKLQVGKFDEAQKLYEQASVNHRASPAITARAIEGLAIALEANGKEDEAIKRFEELKSYENNKHKDLAEYHLGRLKAAKGDTEGAKALLKPLYDRLSDRSAEGPQSRYLRNEVELRLSEIDSSLVDKGTAGGDAQFSQEEIQRLIEQLRLQQGAGGGAP